MIAQIIFFIALGLLIVLLFRRTQLSGSLPRKVGSLAATLGASLYRQGSRLGGTIAQQAKRASGFRNSSIFHREPIVTKSGDHTFWQEEALSEKRELGSHFEEGDTLFRDGKLDEAERFFLKAATTKPNDPRIYGRLGVIYLQTKNYTDAIESLKVAVKLDKYNPSRHYNLALAYWGNKDKQRSISSLREAISLDPVTAKYRQFLEQLLESK